MDWVIFGDDWGRHPSTTQHLIGSLPPNDRVVWVDSIGMRTPGLNTGDLRRTLGKLRAMIQRTASDGLMQDRPAPPRSRFRVVRPFCLPMHRQHVSVAFNRRAISSQVKSQMTALGIREPVVLLTNPVAYLYVDAIPHQALVYLKLDEYTEFPGVEAELVRPVERELMEACDLFCATAKGLLPGGKETPRHRYLPQGVHADLFSSVPLEPPRGKTLGFFGIVGPWLDYDLIEDCARACPDWTFEFLGPLRANIDRFRDVLNVRFRPAVMHSQLPDAIDHWRAAWLPFLINDHINACNPIALREYLASGLAAACTGFPEARALQHVGIISKPEELQSWLESEVEADNETRRAARRASMQPHTWRNRAAELRDLAAAAGANRSTWVTQATRVEAA